jgi:hypothetical protein
MPARRGRKHQEIRRRCSSHSAQHLAPRGNEAAIERHHEALRKGQYSRLQKINPYSGLVLNIPDAMEGIVKSNIWLKVLRQSPRPPVKSGRVLLAA